LRSESILFIVISALLVVAIYSFSTSVVSAKPPYEGSITTCTNNAVYKDGSAKVQTCCKQYYNKGQPVGELKCVKTCYSSIGLTVNCPKRTAEEDMVSPELLGDGALKGESQNTTNVPKGSFLNDGGLLKGQGDNQTTSQRITGPNDRFCIEGTGGDTGTPCLPCDPGLKFVVGCIDVTTGGPLDMPDAATSESGESNDTNPKDLDGSNNDDNGPNVNPGSD